MILDNLINELTASTVNSHKGRSFPSVLGTNHQSSPELRVLFLICSLQGVWLVLPLQCRPRKYRLQSLSSGDSFLLRSRCLEGKQTFRALVWPAASGGTLPEPSRVGAILWQGKRSHSCSRPALSPCVCEVTFPGLPGDARKLVRVP